jgi:drug/metabolite transporter (DMT)-like permease
MINLKLVLIILFAEMWGVGGQLLYKTGVNKAGTPDLRDHRSYVSFIKRIIGIPQIWLGFISVVIGMCVWLTALAQADLSIAFPIDSMQYIITLVAAHYLLGEKINKMKLLGTLLVMCGVIIVAMS